MPVLMSEHCKRTKISPGLYCRHRLLLHVNCVFGEEEYIERIHSCFTLCWKNTT